MSLDVKVKLLTESLARAVDRRKFIKGTGTAMFATIAAAAAGHMSIAKVKASSDDVAAPWPPTCAPPGPYCNITGQGDLSGCRRGGYGGDSGSCFQHLYNGEILQCRVYYTYYQAGCWTTAVQGGAWTCCDCECPMSGGGRRTCGCAQFSTEPNPRPDGPLMVGGSKL
jgi:hypothetical protein